MTLQSKISLGLVATLSSALDLVSAQAPLAYRKTFALTSGTGLNQADKIFSDTRTLAASGTETLDVSGVLADALGATLTMARVKGILVAAAVGNTNNVLVGGGSNPLLGYVADATDIVVVRPGGLFLWLAPDAVGAAVTAATGDLLKVANSSSGTGVTYDVVIIGASA